MKEIAPYTFGAIWGGWNDESNFDEKIINLHLKTVWL